MAGQRLTIAAVGRLLGLKLPRPEEKGSCPFRKHQRQDKTFRVFVSRGGDEVYKCWSCDPPDNVGDAIGLYERLSGVSRREAWQALGDQGFEVPGQSERGPNGAPYRPPQPERKPLPPLRGTQPERVMPLDLDAWASWKKLDTGLLARFAAMRGLRVETLRQHDVVEMPGGRHVGFTYTDPKSGDPCRVKVRGVEQKQFFVVPKSPKDDPQRKALAPLYMGHLLQPLSGQSLKPVIVTEGEVDALTLIEQGFPNVVSLPDGSESVKTSDVSPLWLYGFNVWLLGLDADPAGDTAYVFLRDRAASARVDAVRLHWKRLVGDELVVHKDPNDALKAGFTKEDFVRCFDMATEARYGSPLSVVAAAR